MNPQDASSAEMPGSPFPGRLSREREELVLDMILDGLSLPPEAHRDMAVLPVMLADLNGPAGPDELTGEAAVLSRFKVCFPPVSTSSPAAAPAKRRSAWRVSHRARLTGALAAAAFVFGGAAAAYAGVLPAPVQNFVHSVLPHVPSDGPASGHPASVTSHASRSTPVPVRHDAAEHHGKAVHPRHAESHHQAGSAHGKPSGHPGKPAGNQGNQGNQGNSGHQGNQGGNSTHAGHPAHPKHPVHPGHPRHPIHPHVTRSIHT